MSSTFLKSDTISVDLPASSTEETDSTKPLRKSNLSWSAATKQASVGNHHELIVSLYSGILSSKVSKIFSNALCIKRRMLQAIPKSDQQKNVSGKLSLIVRETENLVNAAYAIKTEISTEQSISTNGSKNPQPAVPAGANALPAQDANDEDGDEGIEQDDESAKLDVAGVAMSTASKQLPAMSAAFSKLTLTAESTGIGSYDTATRQKPDLRSHEKQLKILQCVLKRLLVSRLAKRIELLVKTIGKLQQDCLMVKKQKQEQVAKRLFLQRKIGEIRDEISLWTTRKTALLNAKQIDLRERVLSLNSLSPNGVFTWRVTGVQQRITDAKEGKRTSFYSQSFYTFRYGYKMALRLYLNGDGLGKNAYVSLFIVLLRSPYDAIQRWPFNQKVTIILYDHYFNEHVIDAFKPDIYNPSFRKPENWMNLASGSSLFLPLSVFERSLKMPLNNSSESTPVNYFLNDTLYLKVIVDVSELPHSNAFALTTGGVAATTSAQQGNENRSDKT